MWNVKSPNTGASDESAARWFRLQLHWQTICAQNTPEPFKFDPMIQDSLKPYWEFTR